MSIEFLAGFISGVAGLIVGSPLDVIKTIDQSTETRTRISLYEPKTWFAGLLMPTLGLGILNAILFWSYALVTVFCNRQMSDAKYKLLISFLAGLVAGTCVCFVSVPTELVKVQAQTSEESSLEIVRRIARDHGIRGFCQGGLITILRDSIGYGFYFLAFDGLVSVFRHVTENENGIVLLAGGFAGCISWLSIYPLDSIKTRLQAFSDPERSHLLEDTAQKQSEVLDIYHCAKSIWNESGISGFFRGFSAAMLRAFIVDAVIFWMDALILGRNP